LIGGLLMQCLATPPSRAASLQRNADAYTQGLVDLVLASVHPHPDNHGDR
jgi:hypothetical protein